MSFTENGILYNIINVTECSVQSVNNSSSNTNIIIPPIAYNGITPYNVTKIEGDPFDSISPSIVVSVTIPTSVITIDIDAFVNCINLKNVYFDSLSNITCIEDNAFLNCGQLNNIIIPASIQIINQSAFGNCLGLTTITFLDLTNVITSGAFDPNIFIGSTNLKTIYYNGSTQDKNYLTTYFSTNYPQLNVDIIIIQPPIIINNICVCPPPALPKQGISFGGNLNIPGHSETAAFKLAEIVKTSSTARNAGQTKFYNANTSRSSSNPPPPRNNFR